MPQKLSVDVEDSLQALPGTDNVKTG